MKNLLRIIVLLFTSSIMAQAGHIMQGIGSENMSMGGAATAQPISISGALQWNPAAISEFDGKILSFDIGAFFSSPELSSSFGSYSGITKDDRGVSFMPALAFVWGKKGSKHTFGASLFGISGFGVTFPKSTTNPISMPQPNGFGHIESDYLLAQAGFTWSYKIAENLSIGIQPTFNFATLELAPNPLATPDFPAAMGGTNKGYPTSDKATAVGYGAQFGIYYHSEGGVKIGASYKTTQKFNKFTFNNTYLDGTDAGSVDFTMDYPAILSFGLGYSIKDFDFAIDYRWVNYEDTKGFEKEGWKINTSGPKAGYPTGSVNGFGWKDLNILSAGIQYKGINKLKIRAGYTHSTNPIKKETAFFSIPATAIIKNAYQLGLGYEFSDRLTLNALYHHGCSNGKTEGAMLNPMYISATNPYGNVPGTKVGYEMTTNMIMLGFSYKFTK